MARQPSAAMVARPVVGALACLVLLPALSHAAMLLTSPAFRNFELIPPEFGCERNARDHAVQSPPLQWWRVPAKTQSFVLMVDDIDNPGFVQWIVKDIPRSVESLPADASLADLPGTAVELPNSWGEEMYGGMCPPPNTTHTYRFRLYARYSNESDLPIPTDQPITSEMYDTLLREDKHTIYCAVLAGKFYVGPQDPDAPPAPSNATIATTQPIPVRRYVKPSETARHTRKHYGPRPYGVYPGNATAICDRKQAAEGEEGEAERAQLCGSVRVPEKIEVGGAEEGEEEEDAAITNPLHSRGGITVPYFERTRTTAKPWLVHPSLNTPVQGAHYVGSVPPPPIALALVPAPQALPHARESTSLKSLVEWECGDAPSSQTLLLRSPLVDSCQDGQQVAAPLPSVFVCDAQHGESTYARRAGLAPPRGQSEVSPPLLWQFVGAPSAVKSFVLVLEEGTTGSIYWLVTDIPGGWRELPLGASAEEDTLRSVTVVPNAFGVTDYVSPCAVTKAHSDHSPLLYRYHLFARSESTTHLPSPPPSTLASLRSSLNDEALVAEAVLEVVVGESADSSL